MSRVRRSNEAPIKSRIGFGTALGQRAFDEILQSQAEKIRNSWKAYYFKEIANPVLTEKWRKKHENAKK
jgi:hypothetical protein